MATCVKNTKCRTFKGKAPTYIGKWEDFLADFVEEYPLESDATPDSPFESEEVKSKVDEDYFLPQNEYRCLQLDKPYDIGLEYQIKKDIGDNIRCQSCHAKFNKLNAIYDESPHGDTLFLHHYCDECTQKFTDQAYEEWKSASPVGWGPDHYIVPTYHNPCMKCGKVSFDNNQFGFNKKGLLSLLTFYQTRWGDGGSQESYFFCFQNPKMLISRLNVEEQLSFIKIAHPFWSRVKYMLPVLMSGEMSCAYCTDCIRKDCLTSLGQLRVAIDFTWDIQQSSVYDTFPIMSQFQCDKCHYHYNSPSKEANQFILDHNEDTGKLEIYQGSPSYDFWHHREKATPTKFMTFPEVINKVMGNSDYPISIAEKITSFWDLNTWRTQLGLTLPEDELFDHEFHLCDGCMAFF